MAAEDPKKSETAPAAEKPAQEKKGSGKGKPKEEDLSEEDLALQAEMNLLSDRAGDPGACTACRAPIATGDAEQWRWQGHVREGSYAVRARSTTNPKHTSSP